MWAGNARTRVDDWYQRGCERQCWWNRKRGEQERSCNLHLGVKTYEQRVSDSATVICHLNKGDILRLWGKEVEVHSVWVRVSPPSFLWLENMVGTYVESRKWYAKADKLSGLLCSMQEWCQLREYCTMIAGVVCWIVLLVYCNSDKGQTTRCCSSCSSSLRDVGWQWVRSSRRNTASCTKPWNEGRYDGPPKEAEQAKYAMVVDTGFLSALLYVLIILGWKCWVILMEQTISSIVNSEELRREIGHASGRANEGFLTYIWPRLGFPRVNLGRK